MGISSSSSEDRWGYYSNVACTGTPSPILFSTNATTGLVDVSQNLRGAFVYGTSGLATGSSGTGTAFASFPACAASTNGRLLYDSTNNLWRRCVNGSGWYALPTVYVDNVVSFAPSGVTTGYAFAQWSVGGMFGTGANSSVNVGGQVAVLGVGAGDVTYTLYDETTGTSLGATVTCPCSGSLGTCTSIGGVPVIVTNDNVVHGWRLTTACAGTNPQVNLRWTITHQDT